MCMYLRVSRSGMAKHEKKQSQGRLASEFVFTLQIIKNKEGGGEEKE